MKLTFLGAAGEVTGSCYIVETGETSFLIDCGMFQGGRAADLKNRRFGFDPRRIDFVLLSHAHLDHSGLIPRLTASGFRGPIYVTRPTRDLLGVMLPDSVGGLSAHADQAALLDWLSHFKRTPRQTWVVHGEPLAARALRDEIRRKGWDANVASARQVIDLAPERSS